jgi:ABC-type uncharacterized transport system substrate-binding protein
LSRFLSILLSVAIALMAATAQAGTLNVLLQLSDRSPPYQQFADTLNRTLAASNVDVTITESPSGSGANPDLVIAVGMKATEFAVNSFGAPVLGAMIPKQGYEALLGKYAAQHRSKPVSAIYIEQPLERQLGFIRAALPERSRLGLLYSPEARFDPSTWQPGFAERGLTLAARRVRSADTLFADLEEVLNESDLLLAIPDSTIYNSSNVRNILLTSYRHKVPLVGLSQAYLNAGALCAIFSTPEQIAEQAGAAIVAFATNKRLPEAQYPTSFSIGLNQQVARSLGIFLDSPEVIRERMNKAVEGKK